MKVTVSLFFCFIVFTSSAQEFLPGYILTLEGDTIQGEVFYASHSKYDECRFLVNDEEEVFSPDQIAGYGVNGIRAYTSQIIPSTFLEEVGTGFISLYKNNNYYALIKSGESNLLLNRNKFSDLKVKGRYMGSIKYLTSDCDFKHNYEKMSLSEKSLVNIISKYNECKGDDFHSIKDDLPSVAVEFGGTFGYNFYILKNTTNLNYQAIRWQGSFPDSFNSNSFVYGLEAVFKFPKTSDRFSLKSGFSKSRLEFGETVVKSFVGDPIINKTDFKFDLVTVPLIFQYDILKSNSLKIRALGGFQWAFSTREKSHISKETLYSTLELNDEYDMEDNLLITFGTEASKSIKNFNTGLSLSYSFTPDPEAGGFPKAEYEGLYTQLTMINASFFFRYNF